MKLEALRAYRPQLIALARRHKAERVRVFGSVARNEADANSDIDLLVHFQPDASLFDLIDFQHDAEALLDTRVDIVSDAGLSPHLKDKILAEAIAL